MQRFIKKLTDTEEEDIIFINVEDKTTKKRYFKKMYKIDDQLYKVDLEDNYEIIKFGTTESNNNFILL